MLVILKEGINEQNIFEFYLIGLESYEDFDIILEATKKIPSLNIVEKTDGIYSRIGVMEKDGLRFKIIYHEDVGTYSFLEDQQSEQSNKSLRSILDEMVIVINQMTEI